jgi:Holliday junction DNA helicase RuvB
LPTTRLTKLEIDKLGLDAVEQEASSEYHQQTTPPGRSVLETLASTINEEAITIDDVYEPFLLQQGFLTRTPRGRCATSRLTSIFTLSVYGTAET